MAQTVLQDSGGRSIELADILSPPGAPVWTTGITNPMKIQPQDGTGTESGTRAFGFIA